MNTNSQPLIARSSSPEQRGRLKQLAAGTLMTLGVLAGAEALKSDTPNDVKIVPAYDIQAGTTIPEGNTVHIVQPEENASQVAAQYTSEGESPKNLKDDISEASNKDGKPGLAVGDRIVIPDSKGGPLSGSNEAGQDESPKGGPAPGSPEEGQDELNKGGPLPGDPEYGQDVQDVMPQKGGPQPGDPEYGQDN